MTLSFKHPRQINVMIGSPGGLAGSRSTVEDTVMEWNILNGDDANVVLMPFRWENRAPAVLGIGSGQDVINDRLLDKCHVLIAMFSHRFGTPTGTFGSGTESEVDRALSRGMRVHLLFNQESGPLREIDPSQLEAVQQYREKMQSHGLVMDFSDAQGLREQALLALSDDVRAFRRDVLSGMVSSVGASMRVELAVPANGNPSVAVRNESADLVADLTLNRVTIAGSDVRVRGSGVRTNLAAGRTQRWPLFARPPELKDVRVHLSWFYAGRQDHATSFL